MIRSTQAKTAYQAAQSTTRSDRATEFEAFARCTRSLSRAEERGPGEFARLAEAVHDNRRLWTHVAASVADPDNQLPVDLKSKLFFLAEFVEHQSRRVLRKEASTEVLVELNAEIMRGLSPETEAA